MKQIDPNLIFSLRMEVRVPNVPDMLTISRPTNIIGILFQAIIRIFHKHGKRNELLTRKTTPFKRALLFRLVSNLEKRSYLASILPVIFTG